MAQASLVPEFMVTSLKESLKFYIDTLGFTMKYGRPEEGFAYLDKEGAHIMLEELDPGSRQWITDNLERPFGRGINFQIETSNSAALYQTLQSQGYPIYLELEDKWYRAEDLEVGCRQFIVKDPDGYLLRFSTSLGKRPRS